VIGFDPAGNDGARLRVINVGWREVGDEPHRPYPACQRESQCASSPKAGGADLSIPARLSPKLVEALDVYAAKIGVTRSEAVRRLIEAGLKWRPKAL
jgi:hypothetical protein